MVGLDAARYATLCTRGSCCPAAATSVAGSIALDGVVLTADVEVGDHVVADAARDAHPRLTSSPTSPPSAPGVSLGGDVEVGEAAYIGMNASVREGVRIGADATVGMGSVVLDDVPAGETWVGVPARPIRTGVHA